MFTGNQARAVLEEFALAGRLAVIDIRLRYRRTTLGPFWTTISTTALIVPIALIYGFVFAPADARHGGDYLMFFATGYILWIFISSSFVESCGVFSANAELIRALAVPLQVHVYRMFLRNLIILAHNALLVVGLWAYFQWPLKASMLLGLLGFVTMGIAVLGSLFILSVLCTRFRDLHEIVQAGLQLLFLATPIIWPPDMLRETRVSWLLDLNPIFYLIETIRAPLLNEPLEASTGVGAVVVAAVLAATGAMLFQRFRNRLVYWL